MHQVHGRELSLELLRIMAADLQTIHTAKQSNLTTAKQREHNTQAKQSMPDLSCYTSRLLTVRPLLRPLCHGVLCHGLRSAVWKPRTGVSLWRLRARHLADAFHQHLPSVAASGHPSSGCSQEWAQQMHMHKHICLMRPAPLPATRNCQARSSSDACWGCGLLTAASVKLPPAAGQRSWCGWKQRDNTAGLVVTAAAAATLFAFHKGVCQWPNHAACNAETPLQPRTLLTLWQQQQQSSCRRAAFAFACAAATQLTGPQPCG